MIVDRLDILLLLVKFRVILIVNSNGIWLKIELFVCFMRCDIIFGS